MQVNLSSNRLCGIWDDYDGRGEKGTYNAEGIKAIADALCATASLTKILVGGNQLGDEGTTILCDALRESTISKVEELDLRANQISPDGATAVAALCAVRSSLTRVDVSYNSMKDEGVKLLRDAVSGREGFELMDDDNE